MCCCSFSVKLHDDNTTDYHWSALIYDDVVIIVIITPI